MIKQSGIRTALLTTLAMLAFASNSLLNRLALGHQTIDAVSYTSLRLISGALVLSLIASTQRKSGQSLLGGSWLSALFLFLYATAFSFAYLSLSAGTGALILFGSVQLTMLIVALRNGERPQPLEWLGLCLAFGGLIYLVLPGLSAPPLLGSILMLVAGIAWGFYSLRGRGSKNPLADSTGNFVYAVPMIVLIRLITAHNIQLSNTGVVFATVSGALASGVGYVIWYSALRGLTTTRAAIVQLSVPILAAWGGVILLSEHISTRLLFAGILILGGIALTVLGRNKS